MGNLVNEIQKKAIQKGTSAQFIDLTLNKSYKNFVKSPLLFFFLFYTIR